MAKRKKQKKSAGRVLLRILLVLAAVIALVLLGGRLYFRLPVQGYYAASEKAFPIPALWEGFVPQGLSWDAETDSFLVTGYRKDKTASPVYVVGRQDGALRGQVTLTRPDGTDYTGHAGGLSVAGDYVYVAGGGDGLYVYSRSAVLGAPAGGRAACLGVLPVRLGELSVGVAFTTVHDGQITVGEFYRDPQYPTPESHKFTTPGGERLQALAVTYELDPAAELGVNLTPVAAWALPDLAQGMCFTDDGTVWVSTSWGAAFSEIRRYDRAKAAVLTELPIGEQGKTVPLYALDTPASRGDWKLPPMAEEIEMVEGKLYTMCESASTLYWFGKLTGGSWCYATDPARMQP